MNHIDQLIAQHCPNGVEHKKLAEIAVLKRGTSITKTQIIEGDIPVVAGGKKIAYYHGKYNREGKTIVIAGSGAYAGFVSYWEIPIFVSDAFSVKPDEELLDTKFCYYLLSNKQDSIHGMKSGGGVPHVYIRDVSTMRIPVPPLVVQQEIVKILDTFTALEAALEARKKQYEHYEQFLFTSDLMNNAEQIPLADVGIWYGGGTPSKSKKEYWNNGTIPWVSPKDMKVTKILETEDYVTEKAISNSSTKLIPENSVVMVVRSGILDRFLPVAYAPIPITLNQDMKAVITFEKIDAKYMFYALRASRTQILRKAKRQGGSVASLDSKKLRQFKIPVPPLEEQRRIVGILDKFDALVNDLSAGLPAEIKARRQQYEYYRDKLLTFKELPA